MQAPGVTSWLETVVHGAIHAKFGLRRFRHLYENRLIQRGFPRFTRVVLLTLFYTPESGPMNVDLINMIAASPDATGQKWPR